MDYGVYYNRSGGFLSPSSLSPTDHYYSGQLAKGSGDNFRPIIFADNISHYRGDMTSPLSDHYGYAASNTVYGVPAHPHPPPHQPATIVAPPPPDLERFMRYPHRPLTKQVNQMAYELPPTNRSHRPPTYRRQQPWGCSAPEFLKVFGDVAERPGGRVVLDCVLLGSPRPRVSWLFNDDERLADWPDVVVEDTADLCRLTIPRLARHHYGVYTVVAENEVGHAVTRATVRPPPGGV